MFKLILRHLTTPEGKEATRNTRVMSGHRSQIGGVHWPKLIMSVMDGNTSNIFLKITEFIIIFRIRQDFTGHL